MAALYELTDPRPIAAEAPYTFYLPNADVIASLEPGDFVKVIMRSIPASEKYDAERVWVEITAIAADEIQGTLSSEPHDMPLLKPGAAIQLQRWHIIDVDFRNPEKAQSLVVPARREYWERCLVDKCVLEGVKVHYLYREDPSTPEGAQYPDSGWRIRGDTRGVSGQDLDARDVAYVAVGAVLNHDDSWLPLLDEPIGSSFEKNFDTGRFERVKS